MSLAFYGGLSTMELKLTQVNTYQLRHHHIVAGLFLDVYDNCPYKTCAVSARVLKFLLLAQQTLLKCVSTKIPVNVCRSR